MTKLRELNELDLLIAKRYCDGFGYEMQLGEKCFLRKKGSKMKKEFVKTKNGLIVLEEYYNLNDMVALNDGFDTTITTVDIRPVLRAAGVNVPQPPLKDYEDFINDEQLIKNVI